jgi:hypothetical protein
VYNICSPHHRDYSEWLENKIIENQWKIAETSSSESEANRPASADAILSSGKQIIVSLGHVGACTLKHKRSKP